MFPMNQRAEDLMMNAPSAPASDQLMELGLRIIPQE
jgi:aspartyl-tRNA synthetase